jgi:flagellar biosynthesis/type III secretory pathway chaperone
MILICLLTTCAMQLQPINAEAVESTMVINLERQISTNVADIQDAKESLSQTSINLQQESASINNEFKATTDRDDKKYLMMKMFKTHAKALKNSKEDTIKVMAAVENLTGNLEDLNEAIKASARNGIDVKSEADKMMTKKLMTGMTGMFEAAQAANPQNESLARIADQLAYNDAAFRHAFSNDKNVSIERQIEYLEDQHGVLMAGLKLIEAEKFNLRHAFNLIMQEKIADVIANIDTNIEPIYQAILSGKNMMFSMIEDYRNGSRSAHNYKAVRDISHLGQW